MPRTRIVEPQAAMTATVYRVYRDLRQSLFVHLGQAHPHQNPLRLLEYTQTILDRTLFLAFAEDRGLIPHDTLARAISFHDASNPRSAWQNLISVFRWVDQGNAAENVAAYDGGLFAPNPDVEALDISDEMCEKLAAIAQFDYYHDVSVETLGHIFEQSITDLEEMRAAAGGEVARISKRKADGVYYTPAFITQYIVEATLGRVLIEKFEAAYAHENPGAEKNETVRKRKEIAVWERYRDMLEDTRVIDPACGAGAFLLAAFDVFAREYKRIHAALATLRGGQACLFDLNKTILNGNLFGVDLNLESVAITKLSLWLKTCSRGSKLTYLDRNIKCGDSIVSDPDFEPRDERAPRAFDWKTGHWVRSFITPTSSAAIDEEIDARWRNGFDVVIGNPPYVRQELLSRIKPYLQREYRSYHGTADLYLYFYELGLRLLREGGRLGYISSGTFTRANFAQAFRRLLPEVARLESCIDFGENQPFEGAEMVRPSILILKKAPPAETFRYLFLDGNIPESLEEAMAEKGVDCQTQLLHRPEWVFQSHTSAALFDRLMARGHSLGKTTNAGIRYGVKTGLNEAFIVDTATRDALVRADPNCTTILKKILRGEDLRPWYQEDEGRWLILTRRGIDIDRYPAIQAHLELFRAALEPKPADWSSQKTWLGRKGGAYTWYEIQDSIDYVADFDRPKIFWPNITKLPRFSWDTEGQFINDKGYILPTNDPALLAILQSRVTWFVISRLCTPLRLRAGLWQYQLFAQFIERLPIPDMTPDEQLKLARLAAQTTSAAKARYALHQKTQRRMLDLVPTGKTLNRKLTEWWSLDFATLRAELRKTFKQDIPLRERDDWERLWKERRQEHERFTADILAGEIEMNARVYRLFGLAKDDVRHIEEETKYGYGEV